MNTNNYRRMMFLPVLIIVAEMYIIGYSGLDKNNDVYETVEDGVLYTTGELEARFMTSRRQKRKMRIRLRKVHQIVRQPRLRMRHLLKIQQRASRRQRRRIRKR